MWCSSCGRNVRTALEDTFICCRECGKVIKEDNFSAEPSFIKTAGGQSQLSGSYVRTVESEYSISRERILERAQYDLKTMTSALGIGSGDAIVRQAMAYYTIAVERNFTRGRRTEQVEAACLYIACRENNKAYLLIDFSEYLKINVYVLGAVFLQLCTLLRLVEHPFIQKLVDPSLFMDKFTNGLLRSTNLPRATYTQVTKTAVSIIASMKRDWMQTGRKPSGLCGAALYISALSHGLKYSKSDIINIVHICEATLTKRLIEFENTESGSLTDPAIARTSSGQLLYSTLTSLDLNPSILEIEEFNAKAAELEKESNLTKPLIDSTRISELLCEHKGGKKPHFAHGLCEDCYNDFVKISGGLEGGSDPPAFQHAERERMEKASTEENANGLQVGNNSKEFDSRKELSSSNATGNKICQSTEPETVGAVPDDPEESINDRLHGHDGRTAEPHDESESLSDIDDVEVDGYLHNEEEKHYKRIIWEEMNREYLEEQAAKEAAAAAAKEAFEAKFRGCPEELRAAQELAAAAAEAVAKSRKARQQKRAEEMRNSTPAQTAAEATRQMLTKKRLSTKINYDVLEKLFDEPEVAPKKSRTDSGNSDELVKAGKKGVKLDDIDEQGESALEEDDDAYEDHNGGDYDNDMYNENEDEGFSYEDNYGYD